MKRPASLQKPANRGLPALLVLSALACSGRGTPHDGSAGDDGGPGTGAVGFVPTLAAPPDAAAPGSDDPVRCGEMGLAYASAVAYSPNGALLAVAGPHLRLLDTSDWHEVRQLDGTTFETETLQRLAFVANGTVLVGMGWEKPLGFWRVDDGAFLYSLDFPKPERRPRWQQVAASDTPLIALTEGKTVALWDIERQAVARSIAPSQGEVGPLALSPKADLLAMAEGAYVVTKDIETFAAARLSLWDAERGHLLQAITNVGSSVAALGLSPDARTLAVVLEVFDSQSTGSTWVNFYDLANGQLLRHTAAWRTVPGPVATAAGYLPGGDLVAVPSSAGLTIIRTSDAAVINVISAWGDPVISPDGKVAIAGNSIEIRKISDGTIVDLIPASTGNRAPTFSPDGQLLASVDGDDVVLWRMADGVAIARFSDLGKNVQALAFSPDGRTLASGGKDATVRMWPIDQGDVTVTQKQGQPVTSVVFSPDGSTLATGDSKGNIFLRETKTGTATNVWYGQSSISALVFSPDGRWLVSGGTTPGLRLWDAHTGQALDSASHGAGVVALALSRDGLRLASAAAKANCGPPCEYDEGDPEIRIWKLAEASLVIESVIPTVPTDFPPEGAEPINAHAAVWGLAFAPDGRTLLSAGPQNGGHLYRVPEGTSVGAFGRFFAGTPFAVSPDASRIVLNSSPIQVWCAAGAAGK